MNIYVSLCMHLGTNDDKRVSFVLELCCFEASCTMTLQDCDMNPAAAARQLVAQQTGQAAQGADGYESKAPAPPPRPPPPAPPVRPEGRMSRLSPRKKGKDGSAGCAGRKGKDGKDCVTM